MSRPDSTANYLPALDGLRAVSILLVVASHMYLGHIVPGGLGVTLFFFISGYIITTILLREFDSRGTLDIKAFYVRRFLRLTPALFSFVLLSVLTLLVLHWPVRWGEVLSSLLYYSNYWEILGGFDADERYSPFVITWSLAVEEHYYLVYPLLLLCLLRRRPYAIKVLLAIIVAVLAWRAWLVLGAGMEHIRIYKGSDTRLDSILYGAVFALLYKSHPAFRAAAHSKASLGLGVALLLATLLIRNEVFRETLRYSLQGVAIMLVFAPVVLGAGWVSRCFAARPMVFVGKISYSLYLYHWFVVCIVPELTQRLPLSVRVPLMLLLSFGMAWLSYLFVESIGRLWKADWVRA